MDIGTKIKRIREQKNLTQEHIARALKMSRRGYGKIENNETKEISLSNLEKICKALEIRLEDLLSDEKQVFYNTIHQNNVSGGHGGYNIFTGKNFEKERKLFEELLRSKDDKIKRLEEDIEGLKKQLTLLKKELEHLKGQKK